MPVPQTVPPVFLGHQRRVQFVIEVISEPPCEVTAVVVGCFPATLSPQEHLAASEGLVVAMLAVAEVGDRLWTKMRKEKGQKPNSTWQFPRVQAFPFLLQHSHSP